MVDYKKKYCKYKKKYLNYKKQLYIGGQPDSRVTNFTYALDDANVELSNNDILKTAQSFLITIDIYEHPTSSWVMYAFKFTSANEGQTNHVLQQRCPLVH